MLTSFLFGISSQNVVNITEKIYDMIQEEAEGFAEIGIGIGAVVLLIPLVTYVINILNGGKFELKMLLPLLVFLFVCNFQWVSKPAIAFTTTISSTLVKNLAGEKEDYVSKIAPDADNVYEMFVYLKGKQREHNEEIERKRREDRDSSASTIGKFFNGIWDFMDDVSEIIMQNCCPAATIFNSQSFSLLGVVAAIMSFLADLVAFALKALGIIMSALWISFGPIAFAFAVFPGKANLMWQWFLKLCEFSLYGPICMFLDIIFVKILTIFYMDVGVNGFIMICGLLFANIIAFTAVPSLASAIVSGTNASLSLSQGLQIITAVSSTIFSPVKSFTGDDAGGKGGGTGPSAGAGGSASGQSAGAGGAGGGAGAGGAGGAGAVVV